MSGICTDDEFTLLHCVQTIALCPKSSVSLSLSSPCSIMVTNPGHGTKIMWQGPLLIILLFMLVHYLITEFLIYGVVSTSSSSIVIQSHERHKIGYHSLTQQGRHLVV